MQRIVEQTLNDNAVSLQSTMEVSNTRVVETVKSVLGQVIVPAIEQICAQLFCQLNERFSDGLQEFMEQLRQSQSHATTPLIPDFTTIAQLLEQKRYTQAFEYVSVPYTIRIKRLHHHEFFCKLFQKNLKI